MKATLAFIFFMLFLAGIAFVNLKGMKAQQDAQVVTAGKLTDVAWRLTHLGDMPVEENTPMYLQFDADGNLHGHGGCNRLVGSYALQQGKLDIGPLGSTRMACPEPVNSLEISFLDALDQASAAVRTDSRLALRDDSGTTLARFVSRDRDES